jgi:hypothetical protein
MRVRALFTSVPALLLAGSLTLSFLSCKQYDYASPLPGILEIRLGTENNRTDLLPFSPQNNFSLNVRKVVVRQSGDIRLELFSDLTAIRRDRDGDFYNCLDTLARDSSLILAIAYVPPGTYQGLDIEVTPNDVLLIGSGFFPSLIEVRQPFPFPPALQQLPPAGETLSIPVLEERLTRVTVKIDLDSTLARRMETFEYHPHFYVSSVRTF